MTSDSRSIGQSRILTRIHQSPFIGSVVGGSIIVFTVAAALSVSSRFNFLTADGGALQFYAAIPLAVFAVGTAVTASRFLDAREMFLSVLPIELLIIVWTGLEGDSIVLGSALAVNLVVCVPWLAGLLAGSIVNTVRARGGRSRA